MGSHKAFAERLDGRSPTGAKLCEAGIHTPYGSASKPATSGRRMFAFGVPSPVTGSQLVAAASPWMPCRLLPREWGS